MLAVLTLLTTKQPDFSLVKSVNGARMRRGILMFAVPAYSASKKGLPSEPDELGQFFDLDDDRRDVVEPAATICIRDQRIDNPPRH